MESGVSVANFILSIGDNFKRIVIQLSENIGGQPATEERERNAHIKLKRVNALKLRVIGCQQ